MGGAISDYYNWTAVDVNGPAVLWSTYSTTAITDFAVDYINEHEAARPDSPWFVYQAYNGSHSPFQVPPADLHSVNLGDLQPGTVSNSIDNYKAIVQATDTEIGRLLAEVDLDETTVIYIGDNGTPGQQKDTGTGVRGSKGSAFEGGVRVPFVIAGAGVTRRGREDALVNTADLYTTILEAGWPLGPADQQQLQPQAAADRPGRKHRPYAQLHRDTAPARTPSTTRFATRATSWCPPIASTRCTTWSTTRSSRPTCSTTRRTPRSATVSSARSQR